MPFLDSHLCLVITLEHVDQSRRILSTQSKRLPGFHDNANGALENKIVSNELATE